jgi:hypothetical protein
MIQRLFLAHPRSVGESYAEHLRTASGFALELGAAAVCCAVHAVVPGLFERTASQAIDRLHRRMVRHRVRADRLAA